MKVQQVAPAGAPTVFARPQQIDDLAAAHGIVFALLISAVFWLTLAAVLA